MGAWPLQLLAGAGSRFNTCINEHSDCEQLSHAEQAHITGMHNCSSSVIYIKMQAAYRGVRRPKRRKGCHERIQVRGECCDAGQGLPSSSNCIIVSCKQQRRRDCRTSRLNRCRLRVEGVGSCGEHAAGKVARCWYPDGIQRCLEGSVQVAISWAQRIPVSLRLAAQKSGDCCCKGCNWRTQCGDVATAHDSSHRCHSKQRRQQSQMVITVRNISTAMAVVPANIAGAKCMQSCRPAVTAAASTSMHSGYQAA